MEIIICWESFMMFMFVNSDRDIEYHMHVFILERVTFQVMHSSFIVSKDVLFSI